MSQSDLAKQLGIAIRRISDVLAETELEALAEQLHLHH